MNSKNNRLTMEQFSQDSIREDSEEGRSDVVPMAFVLCTDGRRGMVTLDPGFFESYATKQILSSQVFPALIDQVKGEIVSMVVSAWMVKMQTADELEKKYGGEVPSLEFVPGRTENAIAITVSETSADITFAEMFREDGEEGFTLGPFETPPLESGAFEGHFVENIQKAIRAWKSMEI